VGKPAATTSCARTEDKRLSRKKTHCLALRIRACDSPRGTDGGDTGQSFKTSTIGPGAHFLALSPIGHARSDDTAVPTARRFT
jgi:hypothetical protein